jgi:uncharacterized protein
MPALSRSPLRAFLADPRRPADTLKYHELQGFLFAVACAPELIKPSEWMPVVFGQREAEYESLEEARTIIGELMALYNLVNAAVFENRAALPADCQFRLETLANLEDEAPVSQWSRGFLQGHQWLEESWDAYVPDEIEEDYAAMLMTLSFFESRQLADAYCAETGGRALADMATTLRELFPEAMTGYAHLGRSIQQIVLEQESTASHPAPGEKVGRNEPCPCGSGRKHKKCCGAA